MKTFDMAESTCTACGKTLDAAIGHEEPPRPGDITLCLLCGHVMIFSDELKPRDPTDAEMLEIAANPEVLMIQKVRGDVMKEKP